MRAFFSALRRGDAWIAALAVGLIAVAFFVVRKADPGTAVRVRSAAGEQTLSLSADRSVTVTGGGYTLTVTVRGGRVCVADSDCPGQVCVRTGWISRAGESIVCAPAGVTVTVEGAAAPDGVVR